MKRQPAEELRLGCYPVPLGRGGCQSIDRLTFVKHYLIEYDSNHLSDTILLTIVNNAQQD